MTLQIVRFTAHEDHLPEIEAAVVVAVQALADADPPGVRYAALRLGGGDHVLLLDLADGVENPLPALPAMRALQQALPGWAGGPVAPQPARVLADHRLLGPAS